MGIDSDQIPINEAFQEAIDALEARISDGRQAVKYVITHKYPDGSLVDEVWEITS